MKIYSFLTFITGLLGNIQGIIFQITPIPTVYEGIKKGEIKNITLSYFIINYTSMTFWFNYGYKIKDFFVYALNIPGLFFFTIYINIYIYLHLEKNYFIIINIFLFLLFSISYKIFPPNLNILLGTIIGLISQTTTIPTMRSALIKKDSGFINITLMYVFLFGCVDWLIFGYLKKIYLMVFSNLIQGIFAISNIIIYFWAEGKVKNENIYILVLKNLMCYEESENDNENENEENENFDIKNEEKIQIFKKNYGMDKENNKESNIEKNIEKSSYDTI